MNNDKVKAVNAAKRTAAVGILSGLAIFAYGLWISRGHITHIGHWMGLGELEAKTLFLFVDFLALYGKVMTSKRLQAKARRFGFRVMMFGLALSVICNVLSGILAGSIGSAIYGLFIVVIIVIVERGISITKPKTVNTESPARRRKVAEPAPLTPAQRGAATRKRNRELAELEAMIAD